VSRILRRHQVPQLRELEPMTGELIGSPKATAVTTATIARSRWVRNAAVNASTSAGVKIRGNVRGARTNSTPWRGRFRSRRVGRPLGTGFAATSPRAAKNPYKPLIVDKLR